jgi:KGK domain
VIGILGKADQLRLICFVVQLGNDMNNGFDLGPNDVVSMNEDASPVGPIFKVQQLAKDLAERGVDDEYVESWASKGIECEVLMAGKNWQKGKVRLSLHFVPDKPDSPLDDLRSDLKI